MLVPRLVLALLGAAGLNAGLIVWSVVDRYATVEVDADEPGSNQPDKENERGDDAQHEDTGDGSNEPAKDQAANQLELPPSLPPSLPADPAPNSPANAASPADVAPSLPPDFAPELPPGLRGDLPEVPSLEAMEDDPGFQEFLDIAVEQYPELEHLRDESTVRQRVTADYYGRLQRRLEVVELLVVAANKMAAEGEEFSDERDTRRASEFLQKITQLREIAAGLLVEEL